jgi:hypothetical protein
MHSPITQKNISKCCMLSLCRARLGFAFLASRGFAKHLNDLERSLKGHKSRKTLPCLVCCLMFFVALGPTLTKSTAAWPARSLLARSEIFLAFY